MAWQHVAASDAPTDGEVVGAEIGGEHIAIYNIGGEYFATQNICTHEIGFLSDGVVENGCVECPLHMATFDIASGEVRSGPATEDLRTFPVKAAEDQLFVDVPDSET